MGALLTTVLAAPVASASTLPNFRVGLQIADAGYSTIGQEQFTRYALFGGSNSELAGDPDRYDPDSALIELSLAPAGSLGSQDFRIGLQASDFGSHFGPVQFTPWASQGGGLSGIATDDDGYDPDQYRVFIETRPWTLPFTLNDFRLSIEAVDYGISGAPAFTPWASQGGGRSPYAVDSDGYDPDGFRVGIEVY